MKDQKLKKSHQFTDPNNLPWGTPNADDTRKPAEIKRELEQLAGISPIPQGTQYYGREDSRLITFEQSLPELAGKKLALV